MTNHNVVIDVRWRSPVYILQPREPFLDDSLKFQHTRHSPFHPQSSGLVERLNRTIEDMLSKFVLKHQKDWDKYLPFLMMAYRSSTSEITWVTVKGPIHLNWNFLESPLYFLVSCNRTPSPTVNLGKVHDKS
jgi:hypothetical protein